ncbi:hypothetical protein GC197_03290 [bacterium]|nr:hypothetical protein [bacterium]
MSEIQNHWAVATIRRVLFVAALLSLGSFSAYTSYHARRYGEFPDYLWLSWFLLGVNSLQTILALWLVARTRVWTSWQGWLRAGVYLSAFLYGCMLEEAMTNATSFRGDYHLPTLPLKSNGMAAFLVLMLLIVTWLLVPLAWACSVRLSVASEQATSSRRFSIFGVMAFIAAAAVSLGLFQFVTSPIGWSLLGIDDYLGVNLGKYVFSRAPFHIPSVIAAMLLLYGFSKEWQWAFLCLPAAIGVMVLGSHFVAYSYLQITGAQPAYMEATGEYSWYFITGREMIIWTAFCAARLLGVRPYFGRRREEAAQPQVEVSPIDAN